MKQIITLLMAIMLSTLSYAQLTGVKTVGSGGDYATIEAAISALNTSGVGSGGVTFNVPAGHTETFSAITAGLITATGTASDPVVFQKSGSGANPLVTAPVLSAATAYDGIIRIAGGDYITFDGIDLLENAANTTYIIDWGYAFLRASATDGAQYNEIKNCTIALNKASTSSIGIYSGSVDATGTSVTVSNASGTNSFNKVNGCNISNVYSAISFAGNSAVAYYDDSNEIGVTSGNTITNLGASSTSVRAIYGIYQKSLKVANNNISSSLNGLTTTGYGIFTNTGTSVNIDIYNNIISLSLTTGPFTSTIYGINNGAGSTASGNTVNIYGNTIQNCDFSGATTGSFQGIINSGTAATVNIYNNTVDNVTHAGTGSFIGIYNSASMSTNPLNIYSNTISNNVKTGSSGVMYCIQANTATVNFYQNLIFNNSTAGSSAFYGYYNVGSPVSETYNNNTIYNLTHNGTGILNAFQISTAAGVKTVSGNVIYNLTSGGTVSGYSSGYGAPTNIYNNKIYNLTSNSTGTTAGTVNGILLSGGSHVVYNNFISDLKAPACAATDAIRGIGITSSSTTTTIKLYHNTIYLNASSTGANFGTSGIFHTYSATATTAALDMRNNIVVNKSTANGTGLTVAFRRSNGANLNNFATTSNNNNFYAGTPSATKLIFYDGTNSDQQVADFKTRMAPAESASFSENSPFVNTSTLPYDLHLNTTVATRCESSGQSISGYDTDFDGDYRFNHASYSGAGTATDIGADELEGIPIPICSGMPATSTISGVNSVCDGTGTDLSLSGTYTELGYTYQWKSSSVTGGPYSTTLGTNPIQPTGNLTAATYYICEVTCSNSSQTMSTAEKVITIDALPAIIVTPNPVSYCSPSGAPVALTASGSSVSYVWSPAAGLSATTGTSVDANPSATTTYTVTGTGTNNCINTATATINVSSSILASATATPEIICSGNNSQLQSSATPIQGGIIITEVTTYRTGTGATASYPAYITGQDLVEISNISSVPIDVSGWTLKDYANNSATVVHAGFAFPSGTIIPANGLAVVCIGPGTNDPANLYFNMGGTSDGWSSTSVYGLVLSNANGIVDVVGRGNPYTFHPSTGVVASDWAGTIVTTSAAGIIRTAVVDNNNGSDWVISTASTLQTMGTFNSGYTNPVTISSYTWTPITNLGGAEGIQNPIASGLTSSTDFVVSILTAGGCSASDTVSVTVSSGAAITTHPTAQTVCAGTTATFSVVANGPSLTYQWKKGGADIDGVANASALTNTLTLTGITSADAANYSVVVSSSCGTPVTSDAVALTVKPIAVLGITTNSPACVGETITLTGTSDQAATYSWTGPDGFTSSNLVETITNSTLAKSGTYTLNAVYDGCSSVAATATVTVNPNPANVTATASTAYVCAGGSVDLSSSAESNSFSTITVLDPSGDGGFANGTDFTNNGWTVSNSANNPWVVGTAVTGGNFSGNSAYISNDAGVTNAYTNTLNSLNYFYRDITIPTGGTSINLAFDYISNGESNWDMVQVFTAPTSITPTGSTTYPGSGTTLVPADIAGATYISHFQLQSTAQNASITLPSSLAGTTFRLIFAWKSDNYAGSNPSGSIDNISLTYQAEIPASYSWTSNPSGYTSSNQNNTAVSPSVNTTYTVTAQNSFLCTASDDVTVEISSGAAITVQPTAQTECAGATANFTVTATGPGLTYQWKKGGVDIDGVANASALTNTLTLTGITSADAASYSVVVSSSCGSPVTSSAVALTVKAIPSASIISNSPVCEGVTLTLDGTSDIGSSFSFTGPNGFTSSMIDDAITSPTLAASGTYTLVASHDGCSSSPATTSVTVNKNPDAITVSPLTPAICVGGVQDLAASGGAITNLPLLSENFNGVSTGWTTENNSTGGTPANAAWSVKNDGHIGSYETFHSNDNSSFYMSNSDAQGSGGTTNTILYAPVINTNGFSSLNLSFYHYFYSYSSATNDSIVVEVSTDNTNWVVAQKYSGSNIGTSTSFANALVDLSSYVNQPNVYLRFHYTSAWGYYWCIDNVSVKGNQNTTLAWSPTANLYTDAAATTGYTGTNLTSVYAKPSSTTTYTVTATSAVNCTNSADVTVTVNPLPTASATNAALAICYGDSTQLSVDLTGTAPWDIIVTDGTTPQTITGIAASPWTVYVKPASTTTYSVTSVTDANSCSNTSTAQTVVTVNTPPTLVVNTPSAVCSPATIDLTAAAVTTGSTSGLTLSYWTDAAATTSYTTASSATSGTYYIKGVDANSCFDIEQVVATVHTSPTLSITNPTAVCSPLTIDLTAPAVTNGSTGSLTLSYWTDAIASSSYASASTATNGTYYIKGEDGNGCYDIESVLATVNTTPTLVINTPAAVCSPNTVDITAAAVTTGSTSGLTYTYWTDAGATSVFTNAATAGSGTYYIKGATAENCVDIDPVTVTVNTLPTVTLGSFTDNCFADAAYGLTGGSPADGVYSGTGVNSSGVFTPSTAGVGQHTITYTFTDGNGCANSDQETIDVHPQPIASITAGSNPVTYGFNTGLNGGATAGSGSYSYSWIPTAKIDGLANIQNVTSVAVTANTLYTLTVVDQNTNCQDTARLQLYVSGGPLALSPITSDDSVCYGTSVNLNANSSGGGTTHYYSWTSIPSGFTSTIANPIDTPTQSTWYYVTINDGANSANDSIYVHVWDLPGITLASDVSICYSDSTQLSYAFTGASPFDFSITGAVTTPYTNQTSPWSIYKKPTSTTTYTVNYLTDANGCSITPSGSTIVTVKSLPTIAYTGNDTICLGDSALASAVFTGIAPFSYTYNGITVNNVNSFDHGIYMKPSLTTSYVVTNVTSDNGCSISGTLGSIEVVVNALPSFTHSGNDTICFGDSTAITMNFTGASPWAITINNGTGSFTDNSSTSSMLRYAGPESTTEYKVLNLVDGNGCAISGNLDSLEIFVNPLPTLSFTGLDEEYCSDAAIANLTPNTTGGTFTGQGININSFNASVAGAGVHVINYSYTDGNGCSNLISDTTEVFTAPVNVMPTLTDVCIDATSFTLNATPTGGSWTGTGLTGSSFNPATAGAGSYYLVYDYTDANGCSDIDSVLQVVNALPTVSFSGLANAYCVDASAVTLSGNQFTAVPCTTSCSMPATCTSTSSNFTYEYIKNVTFNGSTQTSTGSAYTDYTTSAFTQVGAGLTYTLSGTIYADANDFLVAFIDWNRDGTFGTDETYSILNGTTANTNLAFTTNITVPSTATPGETKMRISLNWNSAPTSCQSLSYGEVEDYKLNVVNVVPGGTFTGNGITGTTFTPSTAGLGNQVITYTYTDINGCTNSTTNSTQINGLPALSITGLATAYCTSESSATVVATPTGGVLSGNGVTGTYFSPSAAGAGSHYVKYAYTDANSCYNADSVAVTVNSNPDIVMPTLAPLCIGTNIPTLQAIPAGGSWSGNGVSGTSFNSTVAGVGSHYLVYSYTDANSCSDIDSASQVVHALPVVSITSFDASYCTNGMNDTVIGLPVGGTFFGSGFTGNVFAPSSVSVGSMGITYLYIDANGCSNTALASTNVFAFTQPDFTGLASTYCSNDAAATLSPNPTGGVFSGNGVTGSSFDPSLSGSGSQTVTYTFTNSNNCVASQSYSAIVNNAPVVTLAGLDTTYCSNSMGDTLVASPVGGTFNGVVQTGNYFDPSLASAGSNSVVYSYTDANNCSNSATMNTTVNAAPVVALPALVEICADANTTLDAGAGLGYTYLWNTTDTTQAIVVDSTGYGIGTHPFSVMVSDLNGCQATGNSSVTFVEYPEINIPDTVIACGYDPIQVVAGTNANYNYTWSFGANTASVSIDTTITGTGYFNVTVDVANSTGCVASKSFMVKFNPIPVVNLGSDTSICKTHVLTLDAGAGFTYLWSTGATTQTLVVDSLNANLGVNTFSVTVTLDGCSNTDAISVMMNPCTGIDQAEVDFSVNVFPNPSKGEFTLKMTGVEKECNYQIIDVAGKVLLGSEILSNDYTSTTKLDLTHFAKGVYFLKVNNDGNIKVERLVIQ